jgi:uncharacterized glyoxalase superfamily protein PhnB
MQLVHVYLNFPGTTREAFQFYETVFGTKIAMMQTFGETSFMPNVPDAAKPKIMHAQLPITESVHLMAYQNPMNPGFLRRRSRKSSKLQGESLACTESGDHRLRDGSLGVRALDPGS